MIFHRKRKQIPELKVLIDGCNIECVSSFNFLGIMLDQGLSWNNHVDLIFKKVYGYRNSLSLKKYLSK